MQGVQDAQGGWHSMQDVEAVDDILWQSRAEVWDSAPALTTASTPILNAYFANRRADWPPLPMEDPAAAFWLF